MQVRMLWIRRKGMTDTSPELIEAWDEYSIDENPEGAQESFREALDKVGNDLDEFRYITLDIPIDAIEDAFKDTTIVMSYKKNKEDYSGIYAPGTK